MKRILLACFLLSTITLFSQTTITKTVTVPGAGWYRVAESTTSVGRGFYEVTLMTTGGSSTPHQIKLGVFKGWSDYGGINVLSNSNGGYWTDARITFDGTKSYLEINFTSNIDYLRIYLNQEAWQTATIPDVLSGGGGTEVVSSKLGRFIVGENTLTVTHGRRVGVNTSNPIYGKLQVTQASDANDQGIAVFSTNGNKTLRMFLKDQVSKIYAGENGQNKLMLNSTGFVGIGIDSPSDRLEVNTSMKINYPGERGSATLKVDRGLAGLDAAVIQFGENNNYGWNAGLLYNGGGTSNKFHISQYASIYDGNGTLVHTPEFTITPNGNVGIGTTSPKTQLVLGNDFGASISGTTGGKGVFGSNLGAIQGGTNHNKLFTPATHNSNYGYSGMVCTWGAIQFYTCTGNTTAGNIINATPSMIIGTNGNIGIGTTDPRGYKLAVKGNIGAEEIEVKMNFWSDFVFQKDYSLKTLEQVETYIKTNGHLPDVPSEKEVMENGIALGEMDATLLQKVEELTLYAIEQNKEIKELKKDKADFEAKIKALEAENQTLKEMQSAIEELQKQMGELKK